MTDQMLYHPFGGLEQTNKFQKPNANNNSYCRGEEQDKLEDLLFSKQYQQHKDEYMVNGPKYGNYDQIPIMVANDDDDKHDKDFEGYFQSN